MEEFDKAIKICAKLYEIFQRAHNTDLKFEYENKNESDERKDHVESMDETYKQNRGVDEGVIKNIPSDNIHNNNEVYDKDTVNIGLLNPFQCCLVPAEQHHYEYKPSPDKVTIASIIYLIRLDSITRNILKIFDVKRENCIIKSLYALTNKMDHEPGKTRISFQEMVSVLQIYVIDNTQMPPDIHVDAMPWIDAAERNVLGI